MRIDMEQVRRLTALPDDALWAEIRRIAGENGLKLPEVPPTHEELEKLRALFGNAEKIRLSDAMRLYNDYKRRVN